MIIEVSKKIIKAGKVNNLIVQNLIAKAFFKISHRVIYNVKWS